MAKGKPKNKPKSIHVTPTGEDWQLKIEGNQRATKITSTQKEATDAGRKIAREKQAELFIHDKQGKIRDRESYGNDPYPPKDTK